MRQSTKRFLGLSLAVLLSLGPIAQAGVSPVGTLSGDNKVRVNADRWHHHNWRFPATSLKRPAPPWDPLEFHRTA